MHTHNEGCSILGFFLRETSAVRDGKWGHLLSSFRGVESAKEGPTLRKSSAGPVRASVNMNKERKEALERLGMGGLFMPLFRYDLLCNR